MDTADRAAAVEAGWSWILSHRSEPIRRIASEAARYPNLRGLYPYNSHDDLHFSRTVTYPYDQLPFITTNSSGDFEARDVDNRPLGSGDLVEMVRLVADAVTKYEAAV